MATHKELTRRRAHLGNLTEHLCKRWNHEYLLELRESHRLKSRRAGSRTVSVSNGEAVYYDTPEANWTFVWIEELFEGKDNQVRGVNIRDTNKEMQPNTLRRPVQMLIPLKIYYFREEKQNIGQFQTPEISETRRLTKSSTRK